MQAEIIEVMHQQVRAIHRALTGDDLPQIIERDPRIELEHGLLRIYLAVETAESGSGSRTDVIRNQRSSRENSK